MSDPTRSAARVPSLDELERRFVGAGQAAGDVDLRDSVPAPAVPKAPTLDDLENRFAPVASAPNVAPAGSPAPRRNVPSASATGKPTAEPSIMDELRGIGHRIVDDPLGTAGDFIKGAVTEPIHSAFDALLTPVQGERVSAARAIGGKGGHVPGVKYLPEGTVIDTINTPGAITQKRQREAGVQTVVNTGLLAGLGPLGEAIGAPVSRAAGTVAGKVAAAVGRGSIGGAAAGAAYDPDHPLRGAGVGAAAGLALEPVAAGVGKVAKLGGRAVGEVLEAATDAENAEALRVRDANEAAARAYDEAHGRNSEPEVRKSRMLPAARPSATAEAIPIQAPSGPDYTVEPLSPQEGAAAPADLGAQHVNEYLNDRITRLLEQRDQANRAAETDPLTGVANRAALDKALPAAERNPRTAVVVFDANNFGKVNKIAGQEAGDTALRAISSAIQQAAEEHGVGGRVFRRGGDEFVVLAPTEVADAVRTRAEELAGVSTFGDVAVSLSGHVGQTFTAADEGLQAAKQQRKEELSANGPKQEPAPETSPVAAPRETGENGTAPAPAAETSPFATLDALEAKFAAGKNTSEAGELSGKITGAPEAATVADLPEHVRRRPTKDEESLAPSARVEGSDRFRPYHTVTRDGLIDEITRLQDRMAQRGGDTQYRVAQNDDASVTPFTATGRGGVSSQAKAAQNIRAWEKRVAEIRQHLEHARGMSADEIDQAENERHLDRHELEELEIAERKRDPDVDAVPFEKPTAYNAGARVEEQPTFYSRLENAIAKATFEKGTAEQWRAALSKNVAASEREHTGVDQFLDDNAGKVLTRKQLQDVAGAGKIELEEGTRRKDPVLFDRYRDALASRRDAHVTVHNVVSRLVALTDDAIRATGKLRQLPPDATAADVKSIISQFTARRLEPGELTDVLEALHNERTTTEHADATIDAHEKATTRYESYTEPGGDNYTEHVTGYKRKPGLSAAERQELADLREKVYGNPSALKLGGPDVDELLNRITDLENKEHDAKPYVSAHWDEPDVLTHARFNDRVTTRGERVRFIEEIQSDLHQQGREHGYLNGSGRSRHRTAVPDTPLKKTPEWTALALKRVIASAVEDGINRVAWLNGDMAAARFDVAKVADELRYNMSTQQLEAWAEGSRVHATKVAPENLPQSVGKGTAQRLLASTAKDGWHSLEQGEFDVGGEGMRTFYDKIVPNVVRDYAKQMGVPLRVESIELRPSTDERYLDGEGQLPTAKTVLSFEIPEQLATKIKTEGQPLLEHAESTYGSVAKAQQTAARVRQMAGDYVTLGEGELPSSALRRETLQQRKLAYAWVDTRGHVVDGPEAAARLLAPFRDPNAEHLHFLYLDDDGQVLAHVRHSPAPSTMSTWAAANGSPTWYAGPNVSAPRASSPVITTRAATPCRPIWTWSGRADSAAHSTSTASRSSITW
jgi:diguanylate cyclase (GGDEF)-like protein